MMNLKILKLLIAVVAISILAFSIRSDILKIHVIRKGQIIHATLMDNGSVLNNRGGGKTYLFKYGSSKFISSMNSDFADTYDIGDTVKFYHCKDHPKIFVKIENTTSSFLYPNCSLHFFNIIYYLCHQIYLL